ncbi:hypothetical protein NB636_04545 [Oxalobacter aliiformigenes]|uniref:hypothetical protein n=1 Tax=Oxalobacter aliiformigenes TaxID=2946593 RepID=UPI0022AFEEA5|nr:hypothetical protein [Oxalobacter aliiformigenes]MCZ4064983.1 hypothetical protein [Oxalobacter aliiformigenes]WAW00117.1 hypothetical protein NB636_04545 [Oxalobacter aliiformigenes]
MADGDLSVLVCGVFRCQSGSAVVFDDFIALGKITVGVGYGFSAGVDVDGAVVESGYPVFCQGDDSAVCGESLAGQIKIDGLELPDVLCLSGVVFDV